LQGQSLGDKRRVLAGQAAVAGDVGHHARIQQLEAFRAGVQADRQTL